MLVLKRNVETEIVIDHRITVKVLEVGNGWVRLGVTAPEEVAVHRREIEDRLGRDLEQ